MKPSQIEATLKAIYYPPKFDADSVDRMTHATNKAKASAELEAYKLDLQLRLVSALEQLAYHD